ncbi:MAG: SDR family oxidoreductase [Actinomycetia bacterium]|nr:SDR family oxidoreductase [Actinomycetes bacterium]
MRRGGFGRLVNLSGYAARTAGPIRAGIRNAAEAHLTRSLAFAMGRDNITVNAIYPAVTVTKTLEARLPAQAAAEGRTVEAVPAEEAARRHRAARAGGGNRRRGDVPCPLRGSGITGEGIAVAGGAERAVRY